MQTERLQRARACMHYIAGGSLVLKASPSPSPPPLTPLAPLHAIVWRLATPSARARMRVVRWEVRLLVRSLVKADMRSCWTPPDGTRCSRPTASSGRAP